MRSTLDLYAAVLRMRDAAVVALEVVLDRELPVRLERERGALQRVRRPCHGDAGKARRPGRWRQDRAFPGERDEISPSSNLTWQGTMPCSAARSPQELRPLQGAVGGVAPAVISAGEPGCVPELSAARGWPRCRHQFVMRMDRAACGAHEDDGLASDGRTGRIAGGGDLRGMSRMIQWLPMTLLDIALEDIRIAIKGLFERVAGPLGRARARRSRSSRAGVRSFIPTGPSSPSDLARGVGGRVPETPPPGCVEEPHW